MLFILFELMSTMYTIHILFVLMSTIHTHSEYYLYSWVSYSEKVNLLPVAGNVAKFCPSPGAVVEGKQ